MEIDIHNQEGKIIGKEKISSRIFGVPVKKEVVHQVVVAQLANRRRPWAHTKTRGEVRGGGRKPWRQKGTGRARAGSIRSPLWRGGGVVFGPRKFVNYSQKVNKKMRRKAILMCLSDKVKNKKMYVVDKFEIPEIKTKTFYNILKKLVPSVKNILLGLAEKDINLIKSARNIPSVKLLSVTDLNVVDLLWAQWLLTTVNGLKKIEKHFKP